MSGVLRLSLLALVFGAVFILDSVNPAPLDYEARDDDSGELEFKDVPIFNRSILTKNQKPFRYAVRLNCNKTKIEAAKAGADKFPAETGTKASEMPVEIQLVKATAESLVKEEKEEGERKQESLDQYKKLFEKLEMLVKEDQNDEKFAADLALLMPSLASTKKTSTVNGEEPAEETVLYVDATQEEVDELNKKFGGEAELNRVFNQLKNLLKEDSDQDLYTQLISLGSSLKLTPDADNKETQSTTPSMVDIEDAAKSEESLEAGEESEESEEESEEGEDLSELFTRLTGYQLINGMKEHNKETPKLEPVAEAEEMTAAPVGDQHQEEHAGEEEEKEDNSPGFHIKLHIKLTDGKTQEAGKEEELGVLEESLKQSIKETDGALENLKGALSELKELKEQAKEIDKLFAQIGNLFGEDSDEDSDEDVDVFSAIFGKPEKENNSQEEAKREETKKEEAKKEEAKKEEEEEEEDCDEEGDEEEMPHESKYKKQNEEFEKLLAGLEGSTLKVITGNPKEAIVLSLNKNIATEKGAEGDQSLTRLSESIKNLQKLKEENEQLGEFFSNLGKPSEDSSASTSGDQQNADLSLAALSDSIRNLHELKEETEQVKKYFEHLHAAEDETYEPESDEGYDVPLTLYDDSIKYMEHLKKKAQELDLLMVELDDANHARDMAEALSVRRPDTDESRFEESMKNLQELRAESEQVKKFFAQMNDPVEDDGAPPSTETLASFAESLRNIQKLKKQNEELEKFFDRMDGIPGRYPKVPLVDQRNGEDSLSIFDGSIKNLERLKTKTQELDKLFGQINAEDEAEESSAQQDSIEDIKASIKNLEKLKEQSEQLQKLIGMADYFGESDVVHQSSDDTLSALDESIQNIYKLKEQSKQVNKLLALLEDPSEESTENPTFVDQTTTDESMKKVQQPDTASPAEEEEEEEEDCDDDAEEDLDVSPVDPTDSMTDQLSSTEASLTEQPEQIAVTDGNLEESTEIPSAVLGPQQLAALQESVQELEEMKNNYEELNKLVDQLSTETITASPDETEEQPEETTTEAIESTTQLPTMTLAELIEEIKKLLFVSITDGEDDSEEQSTTVFATVNEHNKLPPLVKSPDLEDILKFKKHFENTEPQFQRLISELNQQLSPQLMQRRPFTQLEGNEASLSDLINVLKEMQMAAIPEEQDSITTSTVKAQKSDLATTDSVEGLAAVEAVASEKEKVLSGKRDFTGYRIYRVVIPSIEAAEWILKFEELPGVEFWADPKLLLRPRGVFVTSAADLMVAPDVVDEVEAALRQARMPFEILIKDMQEGIDNENPPDLIDADELTSRNGHNMTWERYHKLEDIDSYLTYLSEAFPKFVQVEEIGRSSEGRPLKVVKLHQETGRANKKAILLDAGIHAREWITPATLTYMINELLDNPSKYDCILNDFDFYFIPMINPDGYVYSHNHDRMWRKTRSQNHRKNTKTANSSASESDHPQLSERLARFDDDPYLDDSILEKLRNAISSKPFNRGWCDGVDANRNFDFQWGKEGSSRHPCSGTYVGRKPFSEPEAKALADFALSKTGDIAMYATLHAYSQMWLIPWGYTSNRPDDYSELYSLAKIGSSALEKFHDTEYLIGTIPDLLYTSSGSSVDWMKAVGGVKYSYALELRDAGRFGFILPASQIRATGEETWAAIYATAVELQSRMYTDSKACPTL